MNKKEEETLENKIIKMSLNSTRIIINDNIHTARGVDLNPEFYQIKWQARPKPGAVFTIDMLPAEMMRAYLTVQDPCLYAGKIVFRFTTKHFNSSSLFGKVCTTCS